MSKKSSTFAPEIGKTCITLRRSKHISNAGERLKRIDRRKTHTAGARSKKRGVRSDFWTPLFLHFNTLWCRHIYYFIGCSLT